MSRLLDYGRRRGALFRYLGYALAVALILLTLALIYALVFRDEPAQIIPPSAPLVLAPLSLGPVGENAPPPPTSLAQPREAAATPPLLQPTLQRPRHIPPPPPRQFPTPPATETPLPTLITQAATAIPSPSPIPTPTRLAQATPPVTPLPTEPSPATVIPHPTPTATPKPRPTAAPTATPILRHTAGIALQAEPDRIAAGQQLQLRIVVQAGETNPVDTVQVYLVFDPAIFEAAAVAAGPDLEVPLQSRIDNNRGSMDYAAGTTGKAMTAPFTLATVTFRAKSATGLPGTYITFAALQSPRQTKAIARGDNRTGSLTSAYIVVN